MRNFHKKHYDIIIKHCTVQILSSKINLLFEQTTKIHKTTIKELKTISRFIVFEEEIFHMSTMRYKITPLVFSTSLRHIQRPLIPLNIAYKCNCASRCKYNFKGGNCRSENIIYKATN